MTKIKQIVLLAAVTAIGLVGLQYASKAATAITYPIPELGSCKDQAACQIYCESKEHMLACVNYGEQKELLSKKEAELAKKALQRITEGKTPGGCNSRESCDKFCRNNIKDMEECLGFAEELGVLPPDELAQAKKVAKALSDGASLPGSCSGKEACEDYCSKPQHIDECLAFAEKAGLFPAQDLAEARKVAKFLVKGETPGKCDSKESCQEYCDEDTHLDECVSFAEKAGLMSQEDLEMVKKTGGKGPGGCKGKDACEEYCNDPAHAEECLNFAKEKNLLTKEEREIADHGYEQLREALDKAPAETQADLKVCLNQVFNGQLSAVLSGSQKITKGQGEQIQPCFKKTVENKLKKNMPDGVGLPEGMKQEDQPTQEEIQKKIQEQIREQAKKQLEQAPQAPPAQQQGPGVAPPTGQSGPPCGSPEECQRMFGNQPPPGN